MQRVVWRLSKLLILLLSSLPICLGTDPDDDDSPDKDQTDCNCPKTVSVCECDLSTTDLESFLLPLGYDLCVLEGKCEECVEEENDLPFCMETGYRQRVSCWTCGPHQSSPSPCGAPSRPYWSFNRSASAAHMRGNNASASNGRSHVHSSGGRQGGSGTAALSTKYFRSCSDMEFERDKSLIEVLQPFNPGRNRNQSILVWPPSTRSARENPDETEAVLTFLVLNIMVLIASGTSLYCQQRAQSEETMRGLHSHAGISSSGSETTCRSTSTLPETRRLVSEAGAHQVASQSTTSQRMGKARGMTAIKPPVDRAPPTPAALASASQQGGGSGAAGGTLEMTRTGQKVKYTE